MYLITKLIHKDTCLGEINNFHFVVNSPIFINKYFSIAQYPGDHREISWESLKFLKKLRLEI